MGISTHVCRAIFREHKFRPLKGKALLIGRQSIQFSSETFFAIAKSEQIKLNNKHFIKDDETRAGGEISDFDFFKSFCDLKVESIDVSDYENADYVHDLNRPIPDELKNKFDFIYDGSCMDNLFNPAMFIENCSSLLKPNGRIIQFEHASAWPGAYLSYSPDWFFDFYTDNNYNDVQVFMGTFPGVKSPHHLQTPWTLYRWIPSMYGDIHDHSYHIDGNHRMLIIIAEKNKKSTNNVYPIQKQYSDWSQKEKDLYTTLSEKYRTSKRINYWKTNNSLDWSQPKSISNLEYLGNL